MSKKVLNRKLRFNGEWYGENSLGYLNKKRFRTVGTNYEVDPIKPPLITKIFEEPQQEHIPYLKWY